MCFCHRFTAQLRVWIVHPARFVSISSIFLQHPVSNASASKTPLLTIDPSTASASTSTSDFGSKTVSGNHLAYSSLPSNIEGSILDPIILETCELTSRDRKSNSSLSTSKSATSSSPASSSVQPKLKPHHSPTSLHRPPSPSGCYAGFKAWLLHNELYLALAALVLAAIQFFALISSIMMFCVFGDYHCC